VWRGEILFFPMKSIEFLHSRLDAQTVDESAVTIRSDELVAITDGGHWRPLNGLQKMMLRWESFHPLNAAHLLTLAGQPDVASVRNAVHAAVQWFLPGPVEFSGDGCSFRCLTEQSPQSYIQLDFHTSGQQPPEQFTNALLQTELNRRFPEESSSPFRFHIVTTGANRWYLLIIYRHVIQDSRATTALARCMLRHLRGAVPTDAAPPGFARELSTLIPNFKRDGSLGKTLPRVLREICCGCISWRAPRCFAKPDVLVPDTDSELLPLSDVRLTSRDFGVTVHDLLLSATHEAIEETVCRSGFRRRIGLYTPVDLRHETIPPVPEASGQILGGYTLRPRRRRGQSFADFVRQMAAETQQIKRSGVYRFYERHLEFMSNIWDCLPRWGNRVAGPGLVPVSALVSNVNLNTFLCDELASGQLQRYSRYTGTGIMTSMMLGLTTCGNTLEVSSTHHSVLFSQEQAAAIRQRVRYRLLGGRNN